LAELDGFRRRPVEVIENGIDLDPMSEPREALRRRLGLSPERQYVICVARFHPVKDHATLIQAFALMASRRPQTDLLLAGDGELRSELERQSRELGLESRIRFLGVRDDVPDLLHASDVFALSSVSEASSLTLLQAMGAGLPAVVTNVGGNPEIIRDGIEGLLVPRQDPTAFARALSELLADAGLRERMGSASRRRVDERFRLERTVQSYYDHYLRAAGRISPSSV
jgi:glycosyltransferase involved in cell wall biosynthesis